MAFGSIQEQLTYGGKFRWGLDGSRWLIDSDRHRVIDWDAVVREGCSFAVWRGGVSHYYADPTMVDNLAAAAEAGIKALGVYFVPRPDASWSSQVANLEQIMESLGPVFGSDPLPFIMLDMEIRNKYRWDTKQKAWVFDRLFTPAEINGVNRQLQTWVDDFQGRPGGGYTYPDYVISSLGSAAEKAYFADFAVRWLAWYPMPYDLTIDDGNDYYSWIPRATIVPAVWRDLGSEWFGPHIWQFGAEANRNWLADDFGAYGSTHVDVNRSWLTEDQLVEAFRPGLESPGQPPTEPGEIEFPLPDVDGSDLAAEVQLNRDAINQLAEGGE